MSEVHVLAFITAHPGQRDALLTAFATVVPLVHEEDGCLEYGPAIDTPEAGSVQTEIGADSFVVVERWSSLAALHAHLAAPHMADYGSRVKHLIADRRIHILSAA